MAPPARRAAEALRGATGALSTAATARMATDLPWFSALSAQERSWVGLIVQAGIRGFVDWYDAEPGGDAPDPHPLAGAVFGAAPRELAGVISLQQTVELIRLSIEVVESNIDELLGAEDAAAVHDAVLRYSREVAFATAEVYARAAEARGAWDARLEALVVDAVVRSEPDETVLSRASALGWGGHDGVAVVLGGVPPSRSEVDVFAAVRRAARAARLEALCATQGDLLVVVLGGVVDPERAATAVAEHFADGPVVVGPVATSLPRAHASATAALSGYRAASGWPAAPRPVTSRDLLAERALNGDPDAREELLHEVYQPLLEARGAMLETLSTWFDQGASVEATARALFVHPNTVRYRLRQVADLTGRTPTLPRDAFTLQLALVLGRQQDAAAAQAQTL